MENRKINIPYTSNNMLQNYLPLKKSDPGSFIVNITIGNKNKIRGMLDLGAEINLMSYSTFKQIKPGEIKLTTICLQLEDKSLRHPKNILEDISVEVGGLIVPAILLYLNMTKLQILKK